MMQYSNNLFGMHKYPSYVQCHQKQQYEFKLKATIASIITLYYGGPSKANNYAISH